MLLTDREMIIKVLNANGIFKSEQLDNGKFNGEMDELLITEILDLMFQARRNGYYRAYDEVRAQKEYERRMSLGIEGRIAELEKSDVIKNHGVDYMVRTDT